METWKWAVFAERLSRLKIVSHELPASIFFSALTVDVSTASAAGEPVSSVAATSSTASCASKPSPLTLYFCMLVCCVTKPTFASTSKYFWYQVRS